MKLKDGLVTYDMDGDQIMVSVKKGFGGMVRSNVTAAFIVDQLKEDTTEERIVDAMLTKFDAPREIIAADVRKILDSLREMNALEE